MSHQEHYAKITEKLDGLHACMFITHTESGELVGRPMGTQDIEFDGTVWFMTDKRSNKCKQISTNPQVHLSYAHSNGVRFVAITGIASEVQDEAKVKEFWNPFYNAWFTGPEDPNITLLKVTVSRAEYWDNKGGKVGALADMAIGAVTGETNKLDEHEVIDFS